MSSIESRIPAFALADRFFRESSTALKGYLSSRLLAPLDIASLVFFRIAFGAIMLWEIWRYFHYGWIRSYYLDPKFFFTYYGFDWVKPWPGNGMYLHFLALGILAVCIALGFFYRVSALLFFFGFTYVFLLDQTHYLNHFYFVSLISFLLIFVPAHRAVSIYARRHPAIRSDSVPAWAVWALPAQMGIVYFYGGLAKLNADWLRGEPMRMWLANRSDYPYLGWLFTQEWAGYGFSYAGLLLDLLLVPFLLWQRTRLLAFMSAAAFHLTNAWLFRIGIFPWFSIAATALFFPPDWPRRFIRWCSSFASKAAMADQPDEHPMASATSPLRAGQRVTITLLSVYFAIQLLVPLRHHLYPGNVSWTEEGHNFSWHMKLRNKSSRSRFFAFDPLSNRTWEINNRDYLTRKQQQAMGVRPDMILLFSHHIANELRKRGYEKIEVRAEVRVSLNGRKHQLMVDPTVNLAGEPRTLMPAKWIVPLVEPLPRRE